MFKRHIFCFNFHSTFLEWKDKDSFKYGTPEGDISFPIFSRQEIKTVKVE